MIETPRPSENKNVTEQNEEMQSKEANARAEADAQTEEQVEQAVPTLGDLGSLQD